ncbi:MAG TPA: FtsX-like permease family protein [Polyangia bacterium]
MTFARLVGRDLTRNPLRLGLTVVAAAVGVLAFVFLRSVITLWYAGVASAQPDRLVVRNKTSITQRLPLAYRGRIAAVEGVSGVSFGGWFGGLKSESRKDFFPNFYVDPESYLKIYPEFLAPPEQIAAWRADPCGAMVGQALARHMGYRPGDRVTLNGTVFPGTWTLNVRGVYRGANAGVDTSGLAFNYRCLNERLPAADKDYVGFFAVRVDDPARSGAVAAMIDAQFASSAYTTKTESERAFQLAFVGMSSAILTAVRVVSSVILLIILLVVGNTLAMGVRERTTDLATLRAIGFRRRHVVLLVLAEGALTGALAAALGIAAAPFVIRSFFQAVAKRFGALSPPTIDPQTLVLAAAVALAVGLLAGVLPAVHAARLPIAEGLRQTA